MFGRRGDWRRGAIAAAQLHRAARPLWLRSTADGRGRGGRTGGGRGIAAGPGGRGDTRGPDSRCPLRTNGRQRGGIDPGVGGGSLPMKIERIVTHALAAHLERPVIFAIGPYHTFTATLVEVITDDGRVGIGECIVRRAPRVTATIVEDLLAPLLVARDPRDVGRLWDEMFAQLRRWGHSRGFVLEAMSGVDIALWDLVAQSSGEPLYRALRGAGRDRVPCYASKVYLADTAGMVAQARQQVGAGYKAIKVQVGRSEALGGMLADVATVRAIREAVGPEVTILLDANGAFDAATAIRFCRQLEPLDLTWLEEPVPPDDVSGYELIRRNTTIPLAGGESEFGIFGFRDLIERRAIDVLQPDVSRIGGFTAALWLGALAHAYHPCGTSSHHRSPSRARA